MARILVFICILEYILIISNFLACLGYIAIMLIWAFAPRVTASSYVQDVFLGIAKLFEILYSSLHALSILSSVYFLVSYYSPFSWAAIRSLQKAREFVLLALVIFAPVSSLGVVLRYFLPPWLYIFDRELTTFIIIQFYNVFFAALAAVLAVTTIIILCHLLFHSYLIQYFYPQTDSRTKAIAREASLIAALMLFQMIFMIAHSAKLIVEYVVRMDRFIFMNALVASDLAIFILSQLLCFIVLNLQTNIPLDHEEEREMREQMLSTSSA